MSKQSTSILALSGYDASLLAAWPPARKERSAFFLHLQWFIERVHVLVMAAPLAGAVVGARYGNNVLNKSKPFGYQSPMDATALPPLITMAAFVMGSVLSNVMSDFKESEKIPAELQGYFQALVSFATTERVPLPGHERAPSPGGCAGHAAVRHGPRGQQGAVRASHALL